MRINDIVNSMWGNVKGLGGRVKNYFGKTLFPEKIERVDVSKRRGNGAELLYVLLAATAVASFINKLKAETINVDPSMTVNQINQVIANSEPNDVINFMEGNYNISPWNKYLDFLPNRDYTSDSNEAILNGSGLEHEILIGIANGGNINISGNLALKNSKAGIKIGVIPYDDIDISGVNFESIYDYSIVIEDREHAVPLESAAVNIEYCTDNGGSKFAYFGDAHNTSPYPAVKHNSIKDKTSEIGAIELPKFGVVTYLKGGGILASTIVLGQDDQEANVFENCTPWNPDDYQFFYSPIKNRYLNAIDPYYGPPQDDNMDVDVNDFYNGHPVMFTNTHLDDGTGAGPLPLVANMNDSVPYFTVYCWLAWGDPNNPDDPNNDPGYDPRADFDNNGIINFIDYVNVAERYQGELGEPISKATNLPQGQYSPGPNDIAIVSNINVPELEKIAAKLEKEKNFSKYMNFMAGILISSV